VTNIVYVSDALLADLVGGGELNDHELCSELGKAGLDITKIRSFQVDLKDIDVNAFYIISNFIGLKKDVINEIKNKCNYLIYEHDHKYLSNRNPAEFKNYKAPDSMVVNKQFYKNAKAVFCQSSFHESIIKKNLELENLYNVSGNLWSLNSLQIMRILSKKQKNSCYSILNSGISHKNSKETVFYCEKKGYKYNLISSKNYQEFLSQLSNNDKFMFLPKTPETLSRVVVEARMMNIKVLTNKRVGASYEPWFNLQGEELINLMTEKRKKIIKKVLGVING
tara:strand:- start:6942 stop:7781 length:840 start_codon:yes stop_codon:yes gene_type:complete